MSSKLMQYGILFILCGWPLLLAFWIPPFFVLAVIYMNGWVVLAKLTHEDQKRGL